jgi:hypothetical protein
MRFIEIEEHKKKNNHKKFTAKIELKILDAKIKLSKNKQVIKKYLVISRDCTFLKYWKTFTSVCNMFSGYYYMYLCTF